MKLPLVLVVPEDGEVRSKHVVLYDYLIIKNDALDDTSILILRVQVLLLKAYFI